MDRATAKVSRRPWGLAFPVLAVLALGALQATAAEPPKPLVGEAVSAEQAHFFEQRIRPLLAESCYTCHATDAKNLRGGLVLDTAAGARIGGDSGPALVPGEPDESRLIEAVRYHNSETQMPPDGRLDDQAIRDLEQWVAMGAPDPRLFDPADVPHYAGIDWEAGREHWAFKPMADPELPEVRDEAWARDPIDRFVLAALEEANLKPAPEADRYTWLRRVTFDLTGLPPTPKEIEAFVGDERSDAHARVVDRLLASPRYGERWGRHWLDLARYADSNGADENVAYAHAWRYRDYVIESFNADTPYDQFVTEQIAGDLMQDPASDEVLFERWTALGYLAVGPKILAEQDKQKMLLDIADEQIDVMSRSLLGLTVSCARCHDHKFDPITDDDYYAMAGIFRSTEMMTKLDIILSSWRERPLATQQMLDDRQAHAESLEEARQRLTQTREQIHAALLEHRRDALADYLMSAADVLAGQDLHEAAADASLEPNLLEVWVEHLRTAADERASPLSLWVEVLADPDADDAARVAAHAAFVQSSTPLAAEHLAEAPLESPTQLAEVYRDYFDALAQWRDGHVGEALYTDGESFKQEPHEPALDPQRLTLEAWVYVKEQGEGDSRRWVVAKNGNEWTDGHFSLIVDGQRRAGAYLNIGGGRENAYGLFSSNGAIEHEQWHHLALTYDDHHLQLYVDGELVGETEIGKPRTTGEGLLNFGRRPDGYVNFHGRVDEVRLYDRPLTTDEVAARHAQPDQPIEAGLVRAWTFDLSNVYEAQLRRALYESPGLLTMPEPVEDHYREEDRSRLAALSAQVDELEATLPPAPPTVMTVFEADEPVDLPVHIRGSHMTLADEPTPRRTPEIFDHLINPPDMPDDASGRLEFAHWLTDPAHPLTARVMVNRIWQHHFGEGLVRTPSNFGLRGEEPSHPELLDHLAERFIEQGWSIKQMHRAILLSSTYRMSTAYDSVASATDPENRLLWRMNRQRLEAEPIRDALLAVGGTLDLQMGGSQMSTENDSYVRAERNTDYEAYRGHRRSVYLPIIRNVLHPMLTVFDYADAGMTVAQRPSTTVSHQALFMMNAPIVIEQAEHFAARLLEHEQITTDAGRIEHAYLLALGRPVGETEASEALAFIEQMRRMAIAEGRDDAAARREGWQTFCHLLMASSEFIFID